MKKIVAAFLVFAISNILTGVPSASTIVRTVAQPRITAATVYSDRAMVTRSATFTLNPGSYTLVFEELPFSIDEDTIRVEGKGTATATVLGVEVKTKYHQKPPEKRAEELLAEIEVLEVKIDSIDSSLNALLTQEKFVDSIRAVSTEKLSKELTLGKISVTELGELVGFLGTNVTANAKSQREFWKEKKHCNDKIAELRTKLSNAGGSVIKQTKIVEVAVEVADSGSLTLTLASIIPNVAWEPIYDARLAADGKTVEIKFRALVAQRTGEDWSNIDMTLSTARPSVGTAPPELGTWNVGLYRPPPPAKPSYYSRSKRAMKEEEYDSAKAGAPAPAAEAVYDEKKAAVATAQVSEEQSSISFHIPRPVDAPSDGTRRSSVVAVEIFPVALEYFAVPKLSPVAFLKSEVVNKAAYPLLPGTINNFIGGTFTGSSTIRKIPAGDKFSLYFGSDDQVSVKRDEIKLFKEGGLFSKTSQRYQYKIEVGNFRKDPQMITVHDQLPVSVDTEVKVTLDESSTKPTEMKPNGALIWKLLLQPGEKKEIGFGIVIEYPKDKEITGL